MQVDVYLKNGRTVFRFVKRSEFRKALTQDPDNEEPRVFAQIKHSSGQSTWDTASVRSISPGSVSHVLEVPKEQQAEIVADQAATLAPVA